MPGGAEIPAAQLDVPPAYTAQAGPPNAAPPAPDWWRGFRSRELSGLIDDAQAVNLDIAVATAQIIQAEAQARIAGAPLFPSVTGNASAEESARPGGTGQSLFSTGLTASYILDFWGKNRATLHAAIETAVASRENRAVVELSTIVAVATTYFQVVASQDRLRIANDNVATAQRVLDVVNSQFKAGTTSQLEVSQQESVVATLRADIPPLELTLRQDMATLAVLVARAPEGFKVKGGSIAELAIPRVTPGLPAELLNRRPDVRQAEAELASATELIGVARAEQFPTLTLTGSLGSITTDASNLFSSGSHVWSLGAGLVGPILDGGRYRARTDQAVARAKQAEAAYRGVVQGAFRDVSDALSNIRYARATEADLLEHLQQSREALRLSRVRYERGYSPFLEVLDATRTLNDAELTFIRNRQNYLSYTVDLMNSLGGGWKSTGDEARDESRSSVRADAGAPLNAGDPKAPTR